MRRKKAVVDELIARAREAKERAVTPYSGFAVGAALLAADGTIYTGCNVESSSYGLTLCAERVALGKAISEGRREFVSIAIVTDLDDFCPPCGACRQLLWDYAPRLEVVLATRSGRRKHFQLRDLFPEAFDNHFLREG
ncbi:MAG: cytidine deaminase [Calditrichaeota bacterium]|nr:cytidine deaminase [Calditrichota bacterium]